MDDLLNAPTENLRESLAAWANSQGIEIG